MQQSNNQSPIYYPCMVLCWHFSCNTIFGVKEVCVRCVSPPTTKPTEDASCVQAIFFALYLTDAEDFPRSRYLLVKFRTQHTDSDASRKTLDQILQPKTLCSFCSANYFTNVVTKPLCTIDSRQTIKHTIVSMLPAHVKTACKIWLFFL